MASRFCYWDAKSKTDAIIIVVNQTIVAALLVVAVLRIPTLYRLYRQNLSINVGRIALIHALVISWAIIQLAINYYSIAVFLRLDEEVDNAGMIDHSQVYALGSAFPGYIIQTIYITICYTFCKNIVRETHIRKFPNYCLKFILVLKVYYFYRLVVWLLAVILIAISSSASVAAASLAEFISLIVDSVVVNAFILASLHIFINRLSHMNFKKLKREYQLMFCVSLCRIVVDCLYIAFGQNQEGFCVSEKHYRVTYSVLYNIIGNYLMHFLPIAVILKIYYFDQRVFMDHQGLIPRQSSPQPPI